MNNPNEVRCERELLVAGLRECETSCFESGEFRQADHVKSVICALESDAKRIAELEGCVAALKDALVKCRDGFANSPRSLGYEYTHLPLIDAALNRPGEASSASDTPMAGKEKVG